MRSYLNICILIAISVILINAASAEEKKKEPKRKKVRHHHHKTTTTESPAGGAVAVEKEDVYAMMVEDEKAELVEKKYAELHRSHSEITHNGLGEIYMNPCAGKHCGAGRVCQVTDEGDAKCVCIPECPREVEIRRKVCTNHNETWGSDCEVYRMRCWCDEESKNCTNPEFKHVHIEYYGECRQMPECTKDQMDDFPRRMRDWLYTIMRDLAGREELSPHYIEMERDAETNMTRKWNNAAIWKWCDLDSHPHDSGVSRHELFPIKAPLMALEHCIAPFLNKCDADDNHLITLAEWGKCLELDPDELEDRCEEVRGDDE
ncbi:unnamed protein product [Bemisia tabaci]|uniref:Follistatin-like domain-containing protein n=1 Tax=Bemisia tabaci TaxID=7038 RepID=A0A9P0CCR6_BEMTA|nr:unnamed protein product [Bemisia tabaci]